MKKFFGILVLSLLICNMAHAKECEGSPLQEKNITSTFFKIILKWRDCHGTLTYKDGSICGKYTNVALNNREMPPRVSHCRLNLSDLDPKIKIKNYLAYLPTYLPTNLLPTYLPTYQPTTNLTKILTTNQPVWLKILPTTKILPTNQNTNQTTKILPT